MTERRQRPKCVAQLERTRKINDQSSTTLLQLQVEASSQNMVGKLPGELPLSAMQSLLVCSCKSASEAGVVRQSAEDLAQSVTDIKAGELRNSDNEAQYRSREQLTSSLEVLPNLQGMQLSAIRLRLRNHPLSSLLGWNDCIQRIMSRSKQLTRRSFHKRRRGSISDHNM
jgi:hypothetical protein